MIQVYVGELGRLRRENALLSDSLQRALAEVKSLRIKYPSAYEMSEKVDNHLAPWSLVPDIMVPLFQEYDSSNDFNYISCGGLTFYSFRNI